jgi:hypothetical protein
MIASRQRCDHYAVEQRRILIRGDGRVGGALPPIRERRSRSAGVGRPHFFLGAALTGAHSGARHSPEKLAFEAKAPVAGNRPFCDGDHILEKSAGCRLAGFEKPGASRQT